MIIASSSTDNDLSVLQCNQSSTYPVTRGCMLGKVVTDNDKRRAASVGEYMHTRDSRVRSVDAANSCPSDKYSNDKVEAHRVTFRRLAAKWCRQLVRCALDDTCVYTWAGALARTVVTQFLDELVSRAFMRQEMAMIAPQRKR